MILQSIFGTLVLAFGASQAAQPLDAGVARALASYDQAIARLDPPTTRQQRQAAADRSLAELAFDTLDLQNLKALLQSEISSATSRWSELDRRLQSLASFPTVEGAAASVFRLNYIQRQTEVRQHAIVESIITHPAILQALADGGLWAQFMRFSWISPDAIDGLEGRLIRLGMQFPTESRPPMLGVLGLVAMFDLIAKADPLGYEKREELRIGVVAALKHLASYQDPRDPELIRQRWNFANNIPGKIRSHIERLEGPAVRGELLNATAPELNFLWNSGQDKLATLEDLRGRVVVLDFWATWCGPCIRSFPRTRELVERYREQPVTVLGVTSVQGTHYGDPAGPIDCAEDPEKEFSLMEAFMADNDMTWTVVFTQQSVTNPDYAVRAIPSVVIIDSKGNVRAHQLHPHLDHERITRHVDELLRELGHPARQTQGDLD